MFEIYMKELGYSNSDITKIRNNCILKNYSEITLYNKINNILCYLFLYGYSMEELIEITRRFPSLYCFSIDTLKNKIENIESLGYSKEEIIKITIKLPALFGKDINDIRRKKRFYDQIGIGDIVVNNTFYLTQNLDLTFARYMFYRSLGVKIDHGNMNLLFMSQESFVKKYGKTNKQLIMLYNYQEYLEKRRTNIKKQVM
mgnify:CR=1 FL=1